MRCSRTRSNFIDTKRVAYPLQTPTFESNHIEPARWLTVRSRQQIVLCGAYQTLPFLPANTRRSATKLPPCTRPHFDKHQRAIPITHDEIYLATATNHVASNEAQPLTLQKHKGVCLISGSNVFRLSLR